VGCETAPAKGGTRPLQKTHSDSLACLRGQFGGNAQVETQGRREGGGGRRTWPKTQAFRRGEHLLPMWGNKILSSIRESYRQQRDGVADGMKKKIEQRNKNKRGTPPLHSETKQTSGGGGGPTRRGRQLWGGGCMKAKRGKKLIVWVLRKGRGKGHTQFHGERGGNWVSGSPTSRRKSLS